MKKNPNRIIRGSSVGRRNIKIIEGLLQEMEDLNKKKKNKNRRMTIRSYVENRRPKLKVNRNRSITIRSSVEDGRPL